MMRRYVLMALLLGVAGGLYWLFGDHAYYFRYRLTVDIEADGKVHSASSVIEVRYWWTELNGPKWAARVDSGIAPMVDLGQYGTVIAALGTDTTDERLYDAHQRLYDNQESRMGRGWVPISLAGLPEEAYGLKRPNLAVARGRVVIRDGLPNFIWVPPSNNWREAKQLWKDEFETVIGPRVRLTQVAIEPAYHAATFKALPLWPVWLQELCRHNAEAKTLPVNVMEFPSRIGQRYSRLPFKFQTICALI